MTLKHKNPPPDHYATGGIETIDFIEAKLSEEEFIGFCKGNVIKYLSRCRYKGTEYLDMKKARDYLDWAIQVERGRSGFTLKTENQEVSNDK